MLQAFTVSVFAEGSRTISPTINSSTALLLQPDLSVGSYLNCPSDNRIRFIVNDFLTEKLFYGFHWLSYSESDPQPLTNMYMRIFNPLGVQEGATIKLSNSGAGYITSQGSSVIGPRIGLVNLSGYTPAVFSPQMNGEYSVEIYQSNDQGKSQYLSNDQSCWVVSPYFDLTISTATGAITKGRVFSRKWAFQPVEPGSFQISESAAVESIVYPYTNDGCVFQVAFQTGFKPGSLVLSSNDYGTKETGIWLENRKSTNSPVLPDFSNGYRLFLNQPDRTVFPYALAAQAPTFASPSLSGNFPGPYKIRFNVYKKGDCAIVLDLDETAGYQPYGMDIRVELPDCGEGLHEWDWNGKDGKGDFLIKDQLFTVYLDYKQGRANLPLYDAEINNHGFTVGCLAPVYSEKLKLYWDDSELTPIGSDKLVATNNVTTGGSKNDVSGVMSPARAWSGNANTGNQIPAPTVFGNESDGLPATDYGNARVLNSWFYSSEYQISTSFGSKKVTLSGTVWNDIDNSASGSFSNIESVGETGANADVYIYLVDTISKHIVATVPLSSNGGFTLKGVPINRTDLQLLLSAEIKNVGDTIPAISLPDSWLNTSPLERNVKVADTNLKGIDFGIQRKPVSGISKKVYLDKPEGEQFVVLSDTLFNGQDYDGGMVFFIHLMEFPANVRTISVDNLRYTQANFPADGIYILTDLLGNAISDILIDPTGTYQDSVTLHYKVIDNGSAESDQESTVSLIFNAEADLSVVKSVDQQKPLSGKPVVFKIIAKNRGPINAKGVQVRDLLPSGYLFQSYSATIGTYSSSTGLWSIGDFANGDSAQLLITCKVKSTGIYTNRAVISGSKPDNISANNQSSVTPDPLVLADLGVTKSVDAASPAVGDTVRFKLVTSNAGPLDATQVVVKDLLPKGYTFVSYQSTKGIYNSLTGDWSVGDFAVSASDTLEITCMVNSTADYVNRATIAGEQQDLFPINNSSTATPNSLKICDLSVVKTVNVSKPTFGSRVDFTITARNSGPNNATGVTATDLLPSGYQFVNSTTTAGTYNQATGVWAIGNLASGAAATLRIGCIVLSAGEYANKVSISGTETDNRLSNNESVVTPVPTAPKVVTDLRVVKTIDKLNPQIGSRVEFTVEASNLGDGNATGVAVSDLLPSGYRFESANATQGSYTEATGDWLIGSLANGSKATLKINCIVLSSGVYTNQATITGLESDPNLANNSSLVTPTPVVPVSITDLAVVKSVDNLTPKVGSKVKFTLVAENLGPQNATGVEVTDLLPSGYQYVGFTSTQGLYSEALGKWMIGSLTVGSTATLTVECKVLSSGIYSNKATISGLETDNQFANNESIVTPVPDNPVVVADLSVSKSINNEAPAVGGRVEFTIAATNNGSSNASGIRVTDLLPSGYQYVGSLASKGSYDAQTGIWRMDSLKVGVTELLKINCVVLASGNYNNSVTIAGSETDNNLLNNSSVVNVIPVVPVQTVDLSIDKTVDSATPNIGEKVRFTVTVRNIGTTNSTGVEVADLLPSGYTFVSYSATKGTYVAATGKWTVGFLKFGTFETLTVDAVVKSRGIYTNKAVVSSVDADSDLSNNSDEVTPDVIVQSDLSIQKTINNATPVVGSRVEFTVVVTNNGLSDATGIKVTDLLPSGYRFVGVTVSQGSYSESTGIWNIGSLEFNGVALMKMNAIVSSLGEYNNTASVVGNEPDNDLSNNSSSASASPLAPITSTDLMVVKMVDNQAPTIGSRVRFTLVASNGGPKNATGVEVLDMLPTGYKFISASSTKGSYSETTGRWTIGNLSNQEHDSLFIDCFVRDADNYANVAYISGLESDNMLLNNVSVATTTPVIPVQNADLSVLKSIDKSEPVIGSRVEFTIIATNNGPDDATGVKVADLLPSGYRYIGSMVSLGVYNPESGEWTIGALPNGSNASLRVSCIILPAGTYTNIARISGLESDNKLENNISAVSVEPKSSVVAADLSISKSVDNLTPFYGDTVTFTVKVTNLGSNDASGVEVYETIRTGYRLVDFTTSKGAYSLQMGEWGIGNLPKGLSETLKIRCVVLEGGSYLNTVAVAGIENDPDLQNNEASITLVPTKRIPTADLSVTKTVDNSTPVVGSRIEFTIVAHNSGKYDATGVNVTDLLPSGYKFSSATTTQGSYSSESGVWTIGSFPNGADATLRIECLVQSSGEYTNHAVVSGNEVDLNQANNEATVKTTPITSVVVTDLKVEKSVDIEKPTIGSRVVFTIVATNAGPDKATGVTVADLLPDGYQFVAAHATDGDYSEITGKWLIGEMLNNASATLTVEAIVLGSGNYRNEAYISGLESDNVLANNVSLAITIPALPVLKTDLSVEKTIDNPTPKIGGRVLFTILAKNNGGDDASGVMVSDRLPAGYQFVNAVATVGTFDETAGLWSVGTLKNGESAQLKITCVVLPVNDYANLATISGLESDTNLANNVSVASAVPVVSARVADLMVVKTIDNNHPKYNDNVEFTLELANNGSVDATGVVVTDVLPAGYRFVKSSATVGAYSYSNGDWIVGNLANGAKATLKINCIVTKSGNYTNKAFVTGFETDNDLSNNMSVVTPRINNVALAVADEYVLPINGLLTGDVSANDTLSLDGGNVWSLASNPAHGVLKFASDGTFSYVPNMDFTGLDEFEYKLEDIDGDASSVKVNVTIADRVEVPEGFSPNGDNVNDELTIPDIDKYPNNRFIVFTRWGNKVYEAAPYSNSRKWNGEGSSGFSFGGNRLPAGVYYYILDLGNGQPAKKSFFYLNR